jgi:hypothetical protein
MSRSKMKKLAVFPLVGLLILSALILPVLAEAPEKTDGFVCPVLGGKGGQNAFAKGNGKFIQIAGGDYSVVGPTLHVPVHATNQNGAGSPGGSHASPGDSDYTAIWATD